MDYKPECCSLHGHIEEKLDKMIDRIGVVEGEIKVNKVKWGFLSFLGSIVGTVVGVLLVSIILYFAKIPQLSQTIQKTSIQQSFDPISSVYADEIVQK